MSQIGFQMVQGQAQILIPEELDSDDERFNFPEMNRLLDRAKSKLFMDSNSAFLAPLLCSMEFRWTESVETCATDGLHIWWNPKDFMGCTEKGRVSSLKHELGHVMRLHNVRRGDRCPDKWNEAGDIAINRELITEGYGIDGWAKPGIGPTPQCPHEVEEDIYDWLPKPGGGGQQGKPQPSASGGGHSCSGVMPVPGGPQAQQQVVNNVVAAIAAADQAKSAGAVPGRVREIVNKFLEPVVPWQTAVAKWLTEKLEMSYTWRRPNRRYHHAGIYLPSRFTDENRLQHIACFQDVSGSIGPKDSIRFNSELKYLWETYKPELMTIIQFDTMIQKIDTLEDGDPFTEIEIIGRGGTCLICVRDWILENEPTAVIVFSDMCVAPMEALPANCKTDKDILWIAVDAYDGHEVPHGTVIKISA
jgi:predicted metal-dependent peptidase